MKRLSFLAIRILLPLCLAAPFGARQADPVPRQRKLATPGVARGAGFGSSVASIGDLDGNGAQDLAVGSPGTQRGGTLLILFLKPDGSLLRSKRIEPGLGGLNIALSPDARFGTGLVALGDLDGDGTLELAVGAPGTAGEGSVWILSLTAKGQVSAHHRIQASVEASPEAALATSDIDVPELLKESSAVADLETNAGSFSSAPILTNGFGWSLAAPGDLDGDGLADLVVGAPFDESGGRERGAIWILGLGRHGELLSQHKIGGAEDYLGGDLDDGGRFGFALASVGDLDGDGRSELAVGAPGPQVTRAGAQPTRGSLWVLFLGKLGGVRHFTRIDVPVHGDPLEGEAETILFGSSIASLGDFNGDGSSDLAVGAPRAGEKQQGSVWLILLRSDGSALAHQRLEQAHPYFGQTLPAGAGLGTSLALLDDLDGNGQADLVVGTTLDDQTSPNQGALWSLLMDSCFHASVSLRGGSGDNPRVLVAENLPERGNTWRVSLDCSEDLLGVAAVLGRTRSASGIFTEAGEVLIDMSPDSFGFLLQAPHQGKSLSFSLPIPMDASSCNMVLYVQGVCRTLNGARFTNALDLVIGR